MPSSKNMKSETQKISITLLGLLPLVAFCSWTGAARDPNVEDPQLDLITLPPGFVIENYATDVPGARSLALGSDGTVFVGSMRPGKVYALTDRNGDDRAEAIAHGIRVVTDLRDVPYLLQDTAAAARPC